MKRLTRTKRARHQVGDARGTERRKTSRLRTQTQPRTAVKQRATAGSKRTISGDGKRKLMQQPTKDKLRTDLEKSEKKIHKLRVELRTLRQEYRELREAAQSAEEEAGAERGEFEGEIARLADRVDVERNGRLKAEARAGALEAPGRLAQAKLDSEAEQQIEKLKSTVSRYHNENSALRTKNSALEAELKRLQGG